MFVMNTIFSITLLMGLIPMVFSGTLTRAVPGGILLAAFSIAALYLLEQRRRYLQGIDQGKNVAGPKAA